MGLPENIAQRYYQLRVKKAITELRSVENILTDEILTFTRAGHKLPFEGQKSQQIGRLHRGSIDLRCEIAELTGDQSWLTSARL